MHFDLEWIYDVNCIHGKGKKKTMKVNEDESVSPAPPNC